MNPLARSSLLVRHQFICLRSFHGSSAAALPMKPGTPIPGLDIYKDADSPVALERSEYPDWVGSLTEPLISMAKLRKMNLPEADLDLQKRYIKLVRKRTIKARNEEVSK